MNCYDGKYTGLDTLINIDGYYLFDSIFDVSAYLTGHNGKLVSKSNITVSSKVFFSSDGFVIADFYFLDSLGRVNEVIPALKRHSYGGGRQGVYQVRGDTIVVQTLYWTDQSISPIETRYLIRSRTNLEVLAKKNFTEKSSNNQQGPSKSGANLYVGRIYTFQEFMRHMELEPHLYIRNRKKFYCNEELYENYKASAPAVHKIVDAK
jgi:hypothetical protein